jgi:hypothetical protein
MPAHAPGCCCCSGQAGVLVALWLRSLLTHLGIAMGKGAVAWRGMAWRRAAGCSAGVWWLRTGAGRQARMRAVIEGRRRARVLS